MIKKRPYLHAMYNTMGEYVILDSYGSKVLKTSAKQAKMFENALENQEGDKEVIDKLLEWGLLYDDQKETVPTPAELFEQYKETVNDLHLVILPTDNCNFRCVYCYEPHHPKIMTSEVQEGIMNFLKQNLSKYESLRVEWFGGEPLCQSQMVNELTEKMRNLCKEYKKPYLASMTTNAYLLDYDNFIQMHRKNRITRYQITIDGMAESHDQQRMLANGNPTFDTIVQNLRDIRDKCNSPMLNIAIRCNITPKVLPCLDEYVDFLVKEFGDDPRFEFVWKIAWETENEACSEYCPQGSLHTILQNQIGKGLKFGTNRRQYFRYGNVCYGSYKNSFVIGTDGTIFKCTISFEEPVNHVGKLKQNGEMILDEAKMKHWTSQKADMDFDKCYNCDIYPSCMGVYCNLNNVDEQGKFKCLGSREYVDDFLEHISRIDNYFVMLEV